MSVTGLLGRLWSAPNTLLGFVGAWGGRVEADRANGAFFVRGGWLARLNARLGYGGIALGDVVLSVHDLPREHPDTYAHELVHVAQARLLGPLYLPATLAGYALGLVRFPADPHDASPLEVWADRASGNADRNRFLRRRAAG